MENLEPGVPQPTLPESITPTPLPPPTKQSHVVPILLTFLLTSTLFIGGFFGYQYLKLSPIPSSTSTTQPTPTPDPTADWKTYQTNTYKFQYPDEIQLKETDGSQVSAIQLGPTQKPDTELYDGISLHFDPREIPGTPMQFATTLITNSQQNLGSTIIQSPQPININDYSGVDYILSDSSTTHYYVLTGNNDMIMVIADATKDPTNQGYANTVAQILSTFKFNIDPSPSSSICGGFAGLSCPDGFTCKLDGNYPDASGTCIKQ